MGKKTKQGKGRQDKYYFLAKEQGYRSRAAFKLIQLNKKYNFLGSARVCIDLCAAPGGWLQVASKYMPLSSVIIGVDLVSMKHIPNVITMAEDITTDSCRSKLKGHLKGWQADVVLHDGSPNVGKAWIQDAYSQSELTLHSLRLATEFLNRGGTFVTKVFRSAEYTSLLFIFNQLFRRVEATKPSASRNTSAEIYVICRGFLAPKHIDPRLLDPRFAFQEILPTIKSATALFKKKDKPNRMGYAIDGPQFRQITLANFVKSNSPVQTLAENFVMVWDDEESAKYAEDPLFTEECKSYCQDIHVLSKHEFRKLLKLRESLRKKFPTEEDITRKAEAEEQTKAAQEEKDLALTPAAQEQALDQQLESEILNLEHTSRRERKKRNKQRLKIHERMTLQMHHQISTALDVHDADQVFRLLSVPDQQALNELTFVDEAIPEAEKDFVVEEGLEELEGDSSDPEKYLAYDPIAEMEKSLDRNYKAYCELRGKIAPVAAPPGMKRKAQPKAEPEVWDAVRESLAQADIKSQGASATTKNPLIVRESALAPESTMAVVSQWFSQGLFQDLLNPNTAPLLDKKQDRLTMLNQKLVAEAQAKRRLVEELEQESDSDSSSGDERSKDRQRRIRKRERDFARENFTVVALSSSDSDDAASKLTATYSGSDGDEEEDIIESDNSSDSEFEYDLETAQYVLAYAKGVLRKNEKIDPSKLVDDSYNRWALPTDEYRPSWYLSELESFEKPQLPITKADMDEMKARAKAVDARPIKKIAEAAGRKKRRMQTKLKKLKEQAQQIASSGDMNDREKLRAVERMAAKALTTKKVEKHYVVRTRAHKNTKIPKAPGGARVHCVDRRLKADKKNKRTADRRNRVKKPRKKGFQKKKKKRTKRTEEREQIVCIYEDLHLSSAPETISQPLAQ